MKNPNRNLIIWVIVFIGALIISDIVGGSLGVDGKKIVFSDFMQKVASGEVTQVEIKGNDLTGKFKDGSSFSSYLPQYPNLVEKLQAKNVEINAVPLVSKSEKMISGFLGWLPFILIIVLWVSFARSMSGGGGKVLGFGRSKAKLLQDSRNKVTFKDVAGIDEAKQELLEVVDFLKNPQKYSNLGARIPRGCLLIGSPGTGKTLLARAIAGEANVPFFSISGSDLDPRVPSSGDISFSF